MLTPENYKEQMMARCVTNVNADWQKEVLEASVKGIALPPYPREAQVRELMLAELAAELAKVSQHGLFAGKLPQKSEPTLDDKNAPPAPKSRS